VIGYRFLLLAEEEMIEAALFYQQRATGLGVDFLDDVQRTINAVRSHPGLGVRIGEQLRRALLQKFPYSLIYAKEPEEIVIVAVAHQRRRPGYWKARKP
jgi:plasmid stabilization system protein ParE